MLVTLVFLTLGQASEPDPEDRIEKAKAKVEELLERARKAPGHVAVQPPDSDKQHLDFAREIFCATLEATKAVPSGQFRVQCNDATKVCLAAPTKVLRDGVESEEPLARSGICSQMSGPQLERLSAEGYRFIEAIAEAPDGWYRDEQGRIVQVNFDLHRRVYFGGAWAPSFTPGPMPNLSASQLTLGEGRADFGIELEIANDTGRELHRLHILEGTAWLGPETHIMATAIRYDFSLRRTSAPLWITTFVGQPHRFDLDLNITGWFETLRYEYISNRNFLTVGSANAAFDIWHSKDLQSYLRLRFGPAVEADLNASAFGLRPEAALEADITMDADGFHHLTASVTGEKLFLEPRLVGRSDVDPQRLRAKLGYEVILLLPSTTTRSRSCSTRMRAGAMTCPTSRPAGSSERTQGCASASGLPSGAPRSRSTTAADPKTRRTKNAHARRPAVPLGHWRVPTSPEAPPPGPERNRKGPTRCHGESPSGTFITCFDPGRGLELLAGGSALGLSAGADFGVGLRLRGERDSKSKQDSSWLISHHVAAGDSARVAHRAALHRHRLRGRRAPSRFRRLAAPADEPASWRLPFPSTLGLYGLARAPLRTTHRRRPGVDAGRPGASRCWSTRCALRRAAFTWAWARRSRTSCASTARRCTTSSLR